MDNTISDIETDTNPTKDLTFFPLFQLPNEIHYQIFHYLSVPDLISISETCSRYSQLLRFDGKSNSLHIHQDMFNIWTNKMYQYFHILPEKMSYESSTDFSQKIRQTVISFYYSYLFSREIEFLDSFSRLVFILDKNARHGMKLTKYPHLTRFLASPHDWELWQSRKHPFSMYKVIPALGKAVDFSFNSTNSTNSTFKFDNHPFYPRRFIEFLCPLHLGKSTSFTISPTGIFCAIPQSPGKAASVLGIDLTRIFSSPKDPSNSISQNSHAQPNFENVSNVFLGKAYLSWGNANSVSILDHHSFEPTVFISSSREINFISTQSFQPLRPKMYCSYLVKYTSTVVIPTHLLPNTNSPDEDETTNVPPDTVLLVIGSKDGEISIYNATNALLLKENSHESDSDLNSNIDEDPVLDMIHPKRKLAYIAQLSSKTAQAKLDSNSNISSSVTLHSHITLSTLFNNAKPFVMESLFACSTYILCVVSIQSSNPLFESTPDFNPNSQRNKRSRSGSPNHIDHGYHLLKFDLNLKLVSELCLNSTHPCFFPPNILQPHSMKFSFCPVTGLFGIGYTIHSLPHKVAYDLLPDPHSPSGETPSHSDRLFQVQLFSTKMRLECIFKTKDSIHSFSKRISPKKYPDIVTNPEEFSFCIWRNLLFVYSDNGVFIHLIPNNDPNPMPLDSVSDIPNLDYCSHLNIFPSLRYSKLTNETTREREKEPLQVIQSISKGIGFCPEINGVILVENGVLRAISTSLYLSLEQIKIPILKNILSSKGS